MEDWFSKYEKLINYDNKIRVETPKEIPSKLAGKVFGGVEWNPLSFGRNAPMRFSRYTKFLKERGLQPSFRTAQFYEARCRSSIELDIKLHSDEEIAKEIARRINDISEDKRERWIKQMHRYDYLKVVYNLAIKYVNGVVTRDEMFSQIPDESYEKIACKLGGLFPEPFALLWYYIKFSCSRNLGSIADAYEEYDPKLFEAEVKIFRDAAELGNNEEGIFYAWSHMGLLYYCRSKYVIDQGKDFYTVSNFVANKKEIFKQGEKSDKSSGVKKSTAF